MTDRVLFTGITPDTGIPGDNITSASDITLFGTTNGDPFFIAFSAGGAFPETTVTGETWTATLTGLLPGTYEMIVWDIPYYDTFGDVQFFNFTVVAAPPITTGAAQWADTVNGDSGNDTLTSAFSASTLNGLAGDDSLSASGWADSLAGGDGADILSAAGSSSLLDGGAGNDSITATGWGSTIQGGLGDDLITVTADGAHIDGGAGHNTIHANGWGETVSGGNDGNIVDGPTGGASITLGDGANQVTVSGWGNHVTTGAGHDVVTVLDGGGNVIGTGAGDDSVNLGLGGNDSVDGGAGSDSVTYAGSSDQYVITLGPTSVTVSGPGGTDVLTQVERINFSNGHLDPYAPVADDLNGDHRADLTLQNGLTGQVWSDSSLTGWHQLSSGFPGPAQTMLLFGTDLFGTGIQVVTQDATGQVGNVEATDTSLSAVHPLGALPAGTVPVIGVGHFDGPGNNESLLLRDSATGYLSLGRFDTHGTYSQANLYTPGLDWNVVGTGDFDGDGKTDILFHGSANGQAPTEYYIWEMDGAAIKNGGAAQGALADPNYTNGVPNGGTWAVKAIADLDGNGSDDLVWQDNAGNLYLWEMNGLTPSAYLSLGNVGSWWQVLGAEDMTGDGKADLIFRGQDGTLWQWQMNGAQIAGGGSLGNASADWHLVH